MSESEQREIEKEARKFASTILGIEVNDILADDSIIAGYIAGATAIAEKKNSQLDSRTLEWGKVLKIRDETIFHLESINTALADHNENYLTQLEAAQEELEKERLRLAACGVAALSNTEESIKNQRLASDSEYFSGSYEDVCRAVNREMNYREELKRVKEVAEKMAEVLTEVLLQPQTPGKVIQQALTEFANLMNKEK